MEISWKKILTIIVIVILFLKWERIGEVIDECQIGYLFVDAADYVRRLPGGLKYATIMALLILLGMAVYKTINNRGSKGGDK